MYLIIFLLISFSIFLIIDLILIYIPKSNLDIEPIRYKLKSNQLQVQFKILNKSKNKETMIPNLGIELDYLDNENLNKIDHIIDIVIEDNFSKINYKNYWKTTIVKSNSFIKVDLIIKPLDKLKENKNIWLKLNWSNYGHFGLINKQNCFLISNNLLTSKVKKIIEIPINNKFTSLAVKTNILGIFDEPVQTISYYCKDIIKKGDILVIGETPLAIMQGRYINPKNINYSFFSKLLCYFFHPTSSLATACGMQLLINKIGITRIIFALIIGIFFKSLGLKGLFYRLTGNESSLIDDISGTTFPYDKSIVLGPINTKRFCNDVSSNLGIDVAVADVNDLGKVKIISTSNNSVIKILEKSLINNPAGNGDQKTPIVLIRKI